VPSAQLSVRLVETERPGADRAFQVLRERRVHLRDPADGLADAALDGDAGALRRRTRATGAPTESCRSSELPLEERELLARTVGGVLVAPLERLENEVAKI